MKHRGKYSARRRTPLYVVIILDALVLGVALLVFAFYHHVLPKIETERELERLQLQYQQMEQTRPTEPQPTEPGESTVSTETTEPDNRTEWQKKFADKFTDEVVITDNSYTSPEVSITIETVVVGEGRQRITYYVADVYVASLDNFKTYTPHGQMVYFDTQEAEEMAAASNAILAMSGDFLTYQKNGFLVRNGVPYAANRNFAPICVLYPDGTMATYAAGKYKVDEIMARNPVHVWSFGPALLDDNGAPLTKFDVSTAVGYPNPRCGIGYYEPGHYCFVTVDGRQDNHSKGMLLGELAQVFADLGCKVAYNLDGGGTSVMLFDGDRVSKQSNGQRELGDILVITESGYTVHSKEQQD